MIALLPAPLAQTITGLAGQLCTQGVLETRTERRAQPSYRIRYRHRDERTGRCVQASLALGSDARVTALVRDLLDHWRRKKPRMYRGEPLWPVEPSAEELAAQRAKEMRRMFALTVPSAVGRRVRRQAMCDFQAACDKGPLEMFFFVMSPRTNNPRAYYEPLSRPGRRPKCRLW